MAGGIGDSIDVSVNADNTLFDQVQASTPHPHLSSFIYASLLNDINVFHRIQLFTINATR